MQARKFSTHLLRNSTHSSRTDQDISFQQRSQRLVPTGLIAGSLAGAVHQGLCKKAALEPSLEICVACCCCSTCAVMSISLISFSCQQLRTSAWAMVLGRARATTARRMPHQSGNGHNANLHAFLPGQLQWHQQPPQIHQSQSSKPQLQSCGILVCP